MFFVASPSTALLSAQPLAAFGRGVEVGSQKSRGFSSGVSCKLRKRAGIQGLDGCRWHLPTLRLEPKASL